MPLASDIILDWIYEDGFSLSAAGWIRPQDLDGDGIVGPADLAELLGNWGPCVGCPADLNGDRNVDAADLATLLGNWGPCP